MLSNIYLSSSVLTTPGCNEHGDVCNALFLQFLSQKLCIIDVCELAAEVGNPALIVLFAVQIVQSKPIFSEAVRQTADIDNSSFFTRLQFWHEQRSKQIMSNMINTHLFFKPLSRLCPLWKRHYPSIIKQNIEFIIFVAKFSREFLD